MIECANCDRPIVQLRGAWTHSETGLARCPMEYFAIPKPTERNT